ncbi:MAG: GreA/GreB family elongation factor [Parvibaculum sp.]
MSTHERRARRPQLVSDNRLPGPLRPVLTLHDHGRLDTALFDELDLLSPMQPRIREKLAGARILPGSDIPDTIVTLGSIVRYQVDGDRIERRILKPDRTPAPNGQYVSVFTPVGLALLGHGPGDTVEAALFDGAVLNIRITAIDFQPEADSRSRAHAPHNGGDGPEAA